jgi:hypothetical protein
MNKSGQVTIELSGQKYTGHYTTNNNGVVTVGYSGRSRTDSLLRPHKDDDPLPVAEQLLREMVEEDLRRG